jgi:transcriptional regulator with XRE-family HTH domain
MPAKHDPPLALRAFAEELRAFREQAGMTREELAARVNYSPSMIAMIETARRTPALRLALFCDEVFGAPQTFTRAEKRLRGVPFSAGFRPFEPYESEAVSLRLFEQTTEDPDLGARMSIRFDALRTEVLTGSASLSLIEKVMDEWDQND